MRQTFTYKEKFSWGYLFAAVVGLAGIVYAFLKPFNIRFKSFTVLEYPNSKYAVIVIGILLIAYAVHKYLKMKAINSEENVIIVNDNSLTFKHLSGYSLANQEFLFVEANELWNKTDEDDGESMIIYTDNGKNRYEFFAENFQSAGEFREFKRILETHCTNITNRD